MPTTLGVIQGRMGSTRLPGKLLVPIAGRPLLTLLVARIRDAGVDDWWLATTTRPEDDVAASAGADLGLRVWRGDAEDVISRFASIIEAARPDWVVRVTADNPFTDPPVIDALVAVARADAQGDVDHVGEASPRSLPLGYVPEVVRAETVTRMAAMALPAHHRSHVTSWARESGRSAGWFPPAQWPARPGWRWTVDTDDDLAMADEAFTLFGDRAETIDYAAMVRELDVRPDITGRNAGIQQRAVIEG
jgi:spore coat polysaccharide biosynthesis protein SpsF